MNTQPNKNENKNEQPIAKFGDLLKQMPRLIIKTVRRNFGMKILALVLALMLWSGLIMQDPTLTRQRSFEDVTVSITGEDQLRRNGLTVSQGLTTEALTVNMSASVPQANYNSVVASVYYPRVDLSRIEEEGAQDLKISTSTLSEYGSVTDIQPATIPVVVEAYVSDYRVPVTINIMGEYPVGFYGSDPIVDPTYVTVSGAESVVNRVARVYVDYDVSKLQAIEGEVSTAIRMRIVDHEGQTILSELVEVTRLNVLARSATVVQTLYPTKTFAIANYTFTEGEPAAGYEVKSITATPTTLVAAGETIALQDIDTLFLQSPVDVSDASKSFAVDIPIKKPSDVAYISTDTINITVEIGPIIETKVFEDARVEIRGATQEVTLDERYVTITVTGPQNQLAQISKESILPYVDAADVGAGVHQLPVLVEAEASLIANCTVTMSKNTVTATVETE